MARTRLDLHNALLNVMANGNVYFQPDENIKLKYPCIIYRLRRDFRKHADNKPYKQNPLFEGILIDYDPDSIYLDKLRALPYCALERVYTANNMNHFSFNIYN